MLSLPGTVIEYSEEKEQLEGGRASGAVLQPITGRKRQQLMLGQGRGWGGEVGLTHCNHNQEQKAKSASVYTPSSFFAFSCVYIV